AADDDVASLDQAEPLRPLHAERAVDEARDPRPRGVDEAPRLHGLLLTCRLVLDRGAPGAAVAAGGRAARAGQDAGAALAGVEGVQDDEAGVVDPAVGIAEALCEGGPQRLADGIAPQIEAARAGQLLAAAEMVVEEEADADHPGRAQRRLV